MYRVAHLRVVECRDAELIGLAKIVEVPSVGPKTAMIGYYLGSLGEMNLPAETTNPTNPPSFHIVEAAGGREVPRSRP